MEELHTNSFEKKVDGTPIGDKNYLEPEKTC